MRMIDFADMLTGFDRGRLDAFHSLITRYKKIMEPGEEIQKIRDEIHRLEQLTENTDGKKSRTHVGIVQNTLAFSLNNAQFKDCIVENGEIIRETLVKDSKAWIVEMKERMDAAKRNDFDYFAIHRADKKTEYKMEDEYNKAKALYDHHMARIEERNIQIKALQEKIAELEQKNIDNLVLSGDTYVDDLFAICLQYDNDGKEVAEKLVENKAKRTEAVNKIKNMQESVRLKQEEAKKQQGKMQ